jgi:hypothetical protein
MGDRLTPRGGSLRPPRPEPRRRQRRQRLGQAWERLLPSSLRERRRMSRRRRRTARGRLGGAAVATPAAVATFAEPPRKRKQGFSTPR